MASPVVDGVGGTQSQTGDHLMNNDKNLMWRDHLPHGWHELFDKLVTDLLEIDRDLEVEQAKQKFGELRVYLPRYSPGAHELIDAATRQSKVTCEVCGGVARLHNANGYFQTLCDEHKGDAVPAKKDPIVARLRVSGGTVKKVEL